MTEMISCVRMANRSVSEGQDELGHVAEFDASGRHVVLAYVALRRARALRRRRALEVTVPFVAARILGRVAAVGVRARLARLVALASARIFARAKQPGFAINGTVRTRFADRVCTRSTVSRRCIGRAGYEHYKGDDAN